MTDISGDVCALHQYAFDEPAFLVGLSGVLLLLAPERACMAAPLGRKTSGVAIVLVFQFCEDNSGRESAM